MWQRGTFIGFVCVAVALFAGYWYMTAYRDATEIARRVRQIADDIDAELVKFFSSLGPEHVITRRYGNFAPALRNTPDTSKHRGLCCRGESTIEFNASHPQ